MIGGSWLSIVLGLAAGFWLLAKGADWLVGGSTRVAQQLRISALVVGLTIVAFGTSAPEIVVSGLAAFEGKADISMGNVLGSNVANIGLVLGACAVVLPRVLESRLAPRELFWLFASLGLLWWVASDASVSRIDAALLLMAFALYNAHVLLLGRGKREEELEPTDQVPSGPRFPWLWIAIGIAAVSLGAKLVVDGAEAGASRLGIPASVVGLTVVAIGTSLPELAAGLGGALRGHSDISIGNVIGSNVFNLLAVIGLVGLIQPLDPAHFAPEQAAELAATFDAALSEDFWAVLAFSVVLVVLPYAGGAKAGRLKGALLLAGYVAYTIWLYASR